MSPPGFTAIGIDVGGTKIAAGLVTFPVRTLHAREQVRSPLGGGDAMVSEIERLALKLAAKANAKNLDLAAIGLGLCEIITSDGSIASHSLVQWPEQILRERLGRIAPLRIEADVRAAARAEALFGAGRERSCFLYISIGTGISSCLVIDGNPFCGARGATGTMASGPLPAFSENLSANRPLSLEQIASGPALVSRLNARGGAVTSAQEVLTAAESGDAEAAAVVESGAAALGGTIGWLVNTLDPEIVILGGGLGSAEGLFRKTLIKAAHHHAWWPKHREILIVPAETGEDAGWLGAAAVPWKEQGAGP